MKKNRRWDDGPRKPSPLFKFVIGYFLVCSIVAFCFFAYKRGDAQEMPIPQRSESKCIDGVTVTDVLREEVYTCVNGEQGAGQLWTP